jgi:hypothetical protein
MVPPPVPTASGRATGVRFERMGLVFDFPDDWSVEVDADGASEAGGGPSVTLVSPGGGFWTVCRHEGQDDGRRLTEAIVAQMRSEYQDIDIEEASETIGGRLLHGYDFNFYCLDLTNTAQVRTLETPDGVYLLICQAEDREWARISPVFAAMTASFVAALPDD